MGLTKGFERRCIESDAGGLKRSESSERDAHELRSKTCQGQCGGIGWRKSRGVIYKVTRQRPSSFENE